MCGLYMHFLLTFLLSSHTAANFIEKNKLNSKLQVKSVTYALYRSVKL